MNITHVENLGGVPTWLRCCRISRLWLWEKTSSVQWRRVGCWAESRASKAVANVFPIKTRDISKRENLPYIRTACVTIWEGKAQRLTCVQIAPKVWALKSVSQVLFECSWYCLQRATIVSGTSSGARRAAFFATLRPATHFEQLVGNSDERTICPI